MPRPPRNTNRRDKSMHRRSTTNDADTITISITTISTTTISPTTRHFHFFGSCIWVTIKLDCWKCDSSELCSAHQQCTSRTQVGYIHDCYWSCHVDFNDVSVHRISKTDSNLEWGW